jgi:phosphatidylethanolamine-binding protein (PEBP) family uncharacterized protein
LAPAGLPQETALTDPAGAKQNAAGYFGPCPNGAVTSYDFVVYALDVSALAGVTAQTMPAQLVAAMKGHTLARAMLTVRAAK